jgi:hypothetical protein
MGFKLSRLWQIALLVSVAASSSALADDFIAECQRIGPTDGSIVNVEFSPGGKFATWAQANTYRQGNTTWRLDYWLSQVTDTGDFYPVDGRYVPLNKGVNWGVFAYWGLDRTSSATYTTNVRNQIVATRVDETSGDISTSVLTPPADRRPEYIYASRIPTASTIFLVYLKSLKIDDRKYFEIYWMDTAAPQIENRLFVGGRPYAFPEDFFSNPRWVPGRPVFVFPFFDETSGVIQVAAHNIATGKSYRLTGDPGKKVDPFPFEAAEYPGEWLMAVVVDDTKIGIYRFMDETPMMTLMKTIDVPSAFAYEQSAETFIWNGKTYVSTGVNDQPPKSRLQGGKRVRSELWIADIDPESEFARKVSTDAAGYTLDPETNITPTGVWMYGYQRRPLSDVHELQKCRTGLGN